MVSVTSLDQDMRKLRMDRYTPKAANEARSWIEETLGERLPGGDLLDALKDGVILCKLVNLAVPSPGVKFKKSPMPFIQMENISHFLRACEMEPLNMPSHDRFLTVDLYESKDPTQVLQCLSAFSRVANSVNPEHFSSTIGPKRGAAMSPNTTGGGFTSPDLPSLRFGVNRGASNSSAKRNSTTFNPWSRSTTERRLSPTRTGGSSTSNSGPTSPPGGISSWSRKADEGNTAPAWNIHLYGYMGGASQGNQGIAFGARRQITSTGPNVPSLAEKERKRKEKAAEEERLRLQAEEAEHKRRFEREAEEERARIEEERLWQHESRKQQEAKQKHIEQQKREWAEQERRWQQEEHRRGEERDVQHSMEQVAKKKQSGGYSQLRGQYLSQYKSEQTSRPHSRRNSESEEHSAELDRIRELERQLEEAKERERQYQQEREGRVPRQAQIDCSKSKIRARERSQSRPQPLQPRGPSPQDSTASFAQGDDREHLRKQYEQTQRHPARPLPEPTPPSQSTRPLPEPTPPFQPEHPLREPSIRPLPDPASYAKQSRTDRYLSSNPPPIGPKPAIHSPLESASISEQRAEDLRRTASRAKPKASSQASRSLLEREMERERERQKEWEEAQRHIKNAALDTNVRTGEGQSWDVNQYGYMDGGDQNRLGDTGAGKRQIIRPRPFGPR